MLNMTPQNRSMRELLQDWLEQWIPRRSKKTVYNFRGEPDFMANLMDVDNLRAIGLSAIVGTRREHRLHQRDARGAEPEPVYRPSRALASDG